MGNFSVRNERNFHNLTAKPKRMHLLDKPNGYASAMVKHASPDRIPLSGPRFPNDHANGKCVLAWTLKTGCAFQMACLAETVSRNQVSERVVLSG
ncbi:hypothetical protein AAAX59_02485 [Collinsella sp. CLA-ER-H2]|uniref:hypothetical protein n=1 Tax=Collinsella sp. CLA-ER-H2 TaxID=3136220 RepID=UPI0032C0033E